MAERRTVMTTKVNLKNGGAIEVRIEKGQIAEISYMHGTKKIAKRGEKREIEFQLKNILDENVDVFRGILEEIEEKDKEYFSYGKSLMDAKREPKLQAMLNYRKESERRLKQMQEEVDRYTY